MKTATLRAPRPSSQPGEIAACTSTLQTLPEDRAARARLTAMNVAQSLDDYLSRPLASAAPFYVLLAIQRRILAGKRPPTLQLLMALCADASDEFQASLTETLQQLLGAGLLVALEDGEGPGYSHTPMGSAYLREARETRLGLWRVHPHYSAEAVCAIVDKEERREWARGLAVLCMQDVTPMQGKNASAARAQPATRAHPARRSRAGQPAVAKAGKGSKALQVDPMWAGLLVACTTSAA